jgi:hypothetical protein
MSSASISISGKDPKQLLVLMSRSDLLELLTESITLAIRQFQIQQEGERRLTSAEAARHLGCTTGFLQKLHRRGLPYEKGRPNFYRLTDLETYRASLRIGK